MDPRQLFFVDETGFEDFARHYGRSPSNYPLPSFAPKVKPDKTCHWCCSSKPFRLMQYFEQAMEHIVLPVLPHNCYLVMDNASIHNDDHLAQILAQKNITLVKLPPYSYDLNLIEMVFGLAKAFSSLRHKDIDNKAVNFQ